PGPRASAPGIPGQGLRPGTGVAPRGSFATSRAFDSTRTFGSARTFSSARSFSSARAFSAAPRSGVVVGRAVPRSVGPRFVGPRGFNSHVVVRPTRFYRPYYTFRPHLNLGFGLWAGYPIVYSGYYGYFDPYYAYYGYAPYAPYGYA